nr:chaperone NapD [Caldimonas sp.]
MVHEELHIASLVVHAVPRCLEPVANAVAALSGAEVHASSPNGKLVVTLEASSAAAIAARVASIQRVEGVLSATLVYEYADSLEAMNEEIDDAQAGVH